jgi:hypothetical protein
MSIKDDVSNPRMKAIAESIALELYEGDWEAELVTREVATSENSAQAVRRLKTLRTEVDRAMAMLLAAGGP